MTHYRIEAWIGGQWAVTSYAYREDVADEAAREWTDIHGHEARVVGIAAVPTSHAAD